MLVSRADHCPCCRYAFVRFGTQLDYDDEMLLSTVVAGAPPTWYCFRDQVLSLEGGEVEDEHSTGFPDLAFVATPVTNPRQHNLASTVGWTTLLQAQTVFVVTADMVQRQWDSCWSCVVTCERRPCGDSLKVCVTVRLTLVRLLISRIIAAVSKGFFL